MRKNIIFPSSINDNQRKYISKLLPVYKKIDNLQYSKSFNLHYNKNINIVEKTNNTKSNNILPDLEDSLPNCSQQ